MSESESTTNPSLPTIHSNVKVVAAWVRYRSPWRQRLSAKRSPITTSTPPPFLPTPPTMSTLPDPTNAERETPNIAVADATLHIGSSILIGAPAAQVWDALTDTSTWPSWNNFVPRVTIREQPNAEEPPQGSEANESTPALSPKLQAGTRFTFHVRLDPFSSKPQAATDTHLRVTEYTAPNPEAGTPGRITWAADYDAPGTMGPWLLKAERTHEVKQVEGGTEVRNWEAQVGWAVYAIRWMLGERLQRCFELWVNDLKGFVEKQAAPSQ